MTAVAVLGTGTMGAGMARSLARADLPVTVWNRTPGKAESLAGGRIRVASSPAEAVGAADVIVTMLYDADAVLSIADEVVAAAPSGAVWLQCATIGLQGIERLAARVDRRLALLDAPVLGTRQPAENGTLVVLASGPQAAFERVAAATAAIGSRTQYVGERVGAATALKLACNAWLLSLTAAAAQSLALATGLGVPPEQFLDAIRGGTQDAPYLQRKGAQMIAAEFAPAFTLAAAGKDADLIRDACAVAGVHPGLVEGLRAAIDRSLALGHGGDDVAALRTAFDRG